MAQPWGVSVVTALVRDSRQLLFAFDMKTVQAVAISRP